MEGCVFQVRLSNIWVVNHRMNFKKIICSIRIPVVTQPETIRRRKRQANSSEMESLDFENFDFDGFDSNFEDIPAPTLDPNFEPAIDLPTGKKKKKKKKK